MIGNLLGLTAIGLLIAYFSFTTSIHDKVQEIPWNEETGKSKTIQSKTNDMSLYIELKKRKTINSAGKLNLSKIKENRTQKGFSTGALECMMSLCPPICPTKICCPDLVYDGGTATLSSEQCVLDGNPLCCPDLVYDGGSALSAEQCLLDGNLPYVF